MLRYFRLFPVQGFDLCLVLDCRLVLNLSLLVGGGADVNVPRLTERKPNASCVPELSRDQDSHQLWTPHRPCRVSALDQRSTPGESNFRIQET